MSKDFPERGAGLDALYTPEGGAGNVGGGDYFVPPAPDEERQPYAAALVCRRFARALPNRCSIFQLAT